MSITPMTLTFTARTQKLDKILRLSSAAAQRIREQFLAMKASMDAFSAQMQRMTEAANMNTGATGRLLAKARMIALDDKAPDTQLNRIPASPFGWIVDVVSRHPSA